MYMQVLGLAHVGIGVYMQVLGLSEKLNAALNSSSFEVSTVVCEETEAGAAELSFLLESLRQTMNDEINKLKDDFLLQAELQTKENSRFRALLKDTQTETDAIRTQILAAKKQIERLEAEIGSG